MKRIPFALRAGTAIFAVAIASTASAQDTQPPAAPDRDPATAAAQEPSPEGEIVITGSRIRRNPLDQSSPVTVVDQEALSKTGLSAVADVLQRLPSAAGGLNSKVNNSGNLGNPPDGGGVGAGSAEIDLRYLGAKRTLVLVDGLRFVNATSASGIPATVDLNTMPANMIERIEVLQAGASPLYGSDAIAGVVNVITVASQKGFRASAQYGQYLKYNDGKTKDFQISWGNGTDGPVKIAVGAAYVDQKAVRSSDRDISLFPNPGQTTCNIPSSPCSSASAGGRFITFLGSQTIGTAPDNTPTLAELRPFTNADRFNFAPYQYILTPSKRYGLWGSFKTEVAENTNLRIRASWNRRKSQNQAAFEPLFIGPDAGNGAGSLFDTLSFDVTNPFNPFGVTLESGLNPDGTPNGNAANYSFVARRLIEAGQRTFNQQVNTYSLVATLDGELPFLGRTWYWDFNADFGRNRAKQSFTGNVRADRVAQAIGPSMNIGGVNRCVAVSGDPTTVIADCVPLNLFGGAGSITPDMLNWIAFTERDSSKQKLASYSANITGDLFDLPAGPVGLALGVEHRFQRASFTPDPIVSAGLGADIPAQPAAGSYNVDEIYGELRIPLLKDQPFAYSLEVNGALRHSEYSKSGGSTTYTVTGLYKPVRDFLVRGAYSTGFRAPSLGELFGGRSRFDLPANDPCTNDPGANPPTAWQTSPVVQANCIANGVPAGGTYQEPQGGQLPIITQGNENLKPEKSKNLTFGAVYSPEWARRDGGLLNLEVDYYDIKVTDAIGAVDPNVTLNNCAFLGDADSCALIKRTANGFINEIDGTLGNLDSIRTKGIDFSVLYRTPQFSAGRFGIAVNATHLLKYVLTASNGFVVLDRKGTEKGTPDQAYPTWKGNATLDWSLGDFAAAWTARYIKSVIEQGGPDGTNRLGSRLYHDVQVLFTPSMLDQRVQLAVGVNNLFDKDPPACFSCGVNNYDPTTYDVPGRFAYARISYKM